MYLGIDIGTSAVKVCLADAGLSSVATESQPLTISHPRPGWSEQTPQDWWSAVRTATRALLAKSPGAADKLRAIGLSGQMHGAVLLDAGGAVLRPAILWNDGRSDAECTALEETHPELAAIAGVRPMAGFTAPKLLWLHRHEPEIHARIARILLPKDYIGHRLHGGFVTDPCDAAGTWWFDEADRNWSDRLCAATATDPAWLPRVVPGTETAGTLTAEAAADLGRPAGRRRCGRRGGGGHRRGRRGAGPRLCLARHLGAAFRGLGPLCGRPRPGAAFLRPLPARPVVPDGRDAERRAPDELVRRSHRPTGGPTGCRGR